MPEIDKSNKTLEQVTDKNGVTTRRWKGRKQRDASTNADKLGKVDAKPPTPRNAREAKQGVFASSEPHLAGEGLNDTFKGFMDKDNIFIARDGSDFNGEINIAVDKENEDPADVAYGMTQRYGLERARCIDSGEDGTGVLQFRGNLSSTSSLVSEYQGEDRAKVENSLRRQYGIDDLDKGQYSAAQRRRARTVAAEVADKLEAKERADEEYAEAVSRLSEFGESSYNLPDGRTVDLSQGYRFSADEFAKRYPQEKFPEMWEPRPKPASELKKIVGKDDYDEMRTPNRSMSVHVFGADD